jgi:hypothetical protein
MIDSSTIDPRREAHDRVGGRFEVRVLEPSPPAVTEAPWFADDPVAVDGVRPGATVVTPMPSIGITWDALARDETTLAQWCADRWLGAWRSIPPIGDLAAFTSTRLAWHTLAEHVLVPARHHTNGKIGLRYTRAGFGTPFFGSDEQVRVAGSELVVVRDGRATSRSITTVADAARTVGITPGAPPDVYSASTALDPDAVLTVDEESARQLGDWFGFACSVLEVLRAGARPDDDPGRVQLWPEHFDLSVDLGDEASGARATYGASPGDEAHPEPYLYVTPWARQPAGAVWNDTTFPGASLPLSSLAVGVRQRALALAFLVRPYTLLRGHQSP